MTSSDSDNSDRERITTREQAKAAADALLASARAEQQRVAVLSLTGHADLALRAGWGAAAVSISRQFLIQALVRWNLSK